MHPFKQPFFLQPVPDHRLCQKLEHRCRFPSLPGSFFCGGVSLSSIYLYLSASLTPSPPLFVLFSPLRLAAFNFCSFSSRYFWPFFVTMQPPRSSALLLSLLLAAPVHASTMLSCNKILVDGHNFDLSPLGGPHSVVTSRFESSTGAHSNTTYTVDICQPLKKSGKAKSKEECPNGTRGEDYLSLLLGHLCFREYLTNARSLCHYPVPQGRPRLRHKSRCHCGWA